MLNAALNRRDENRALKRLPLPNSLCISNWD